jgi:hypothetical protein
LPEPGCRFFENTGVAGNAKVIAAKIKIAATKRAAMKITI